MVIGSITYCFLTLTQLLAILVHKNPSWEKFHWPIWSAIIVMSIINGWGNALLFVCSSKYVNECANDTNKGLYNSILWVFNTGSLITGNIIAAFVIPGLTTAWYFGICLILNFFTCFYFLLIKPPRP